MQPSAPPILTGSVAVRRVGALALALALAACAPVEPEAPPPLPPTPEPSEPAANPESGKPGTGIDESGLRLPKDLLSLPKDTDLQATNPPAIPRDPVPAGVISIPPGNRPTPDQSDPLPPTIEP